MSLTALRFAEDVYKRQLAAIRFLMNFIKKHDFKPFGYYRIALGIIILIVFGLLGKL